MNPTLAKVSHRWVHIAIVSCFWPVCINFITLATCGLYQSLSAIFWRLAFTVFVHFCSTVVGGKKDQINRTFLSIRTEPALYPKNSQNGWGVLIGPGHWTGGKGLKDGLGELGWFPCRPSRQT